MKIKETIVVEGRHDQAVLERLLDANIVITHGNHLSQATLEHLKELNHTDGIILFTDPDTPGKNLRTRILAEIPDAKQAFLPQSLARAKRKVGIEHALDADILEALSHVMTPCERPSDLSMRDLVELGLAGHVDANALRTQVCHQLHLEEGNAKRFLKQCRHFGITKKDLSTHV